MERRKEKLPTVTFLTGTFNNQPTVLKSAITASTWADKPTTTHFVTRDSLRKSIFGKADHFQWTLRAAPLQFSMDPLKIVYLVQAGHGIWNAEKPIEKINTAVRWLLECDSDGDDVLAEEDLEATIRSFIEMAKVPHNTYDQMSIIQCIMILTFTIIMLRAFKINYHETNKKCKVCRPTLLMGLYFPMFDANPDVKLLEKICCAYFRDKKGLEFHSSIEIYLQQQILSGLDYNGSKQKLQEELTHQLKNFTSDFLMESDRIIDLLVQF